jgi:methyltransferase family protein
MKVRNYCRPDFALPGLRDLISWLPSATIMAEVGSFAGESAEEFLKHTKISHLHAIDPWQGGYDPNDPASPLSGLPVIEAEFDHRMKAFPGRCTKYRMTSADAARLFRDRSLDFVYIDALHTYEGVRSDIALWLPKIREGGFIGGHDYVSSFPGVIRAVNEAVGSPDQSFSDQSWIKRVSHAQEA